MKNNLYYIQDDDRPMHVAAENWNSALSKWQKLIAEENECKPEDCQPLGVSFIADADDFVV